MYRHPSGPLRGLLPLRSLHAAQFLGDWLAHFPRDQLLILRYEDYITAQAEHMDALFKFLGACPTAQAQQADALALVVSFGVSPVCAAHSDVAYLLRPGAQQLCWTNWYIFMYIRACVLASVLSTVASTLVLTAPCAVSWPAPHIVYCLPHTRVIAYPARREMTCLTRSVIACHTCHGIPCTTCSTACTQA